MPAAGATALCRRDFPAADGCRSAGARQRPRRAWDGWDDREAVEPLVKCLGDPSKIVWRAAAWALRRLGNEGIGVEAIKAALR